MQGKPQSSTWAADMSCETFVMDSKMLPAIIVQDMSVPDGKRDVRPDGNAHFPDASVQTNVENGSERTRARLQSTAIGESLFNQSLFHLELSHVSELSNIMGCSSIFQSSDLLGVPGGEVAPVELLVKSLDQHEKHNTTLEKNLAELSAELRRLKQDNNEKSLALQKLERKNEETLNYADEIRITNVDLRKKLESSEAKLREFADSEQKARELVFYHYFTLHK